MEGKPDKKKKKKGKKGGSPKEAGLISPVSVLAATAVAYCSRRYHMQYLLHNTGQGWMKKEKRRCFLMSCTLQKPRCSVGWTYFPIREVDRHAAPVPSMKRRGSFVFGKRLSLSRVNICKVKDLISYVLPYTTGKPHFFTLGSIGSANFVSWVWHYIRTNGQKVLCPKQSTKY